MIGGVRYFDHADLRLAFDVVGDGVPVVLHCGAAGDSRMWRDAGYVAGLADFQVVLLDPRGHGQSDAPVDRRRHSVGDYANDVIALMDELGVDQFAFWGHSAGGRVGFEVAATQPARVLALVAAGVDDGPDDDPAEWLEFGRLVRERGTGFVLGDEEMPAWAFHQVVEEHEDEVFARQVDCLAEWELWPLLPKVRAPTLLIAGEFEAENQGAICAALDDGAVIIIPDLGHVGAFLHSELVLPHVIPFLRSATRTRQGAV